MINNCDGDASNVETAKAFIEQEKAGFSSPSSIKVAQSNGAYVVSMKGSGPDVAVVIAPDPSDLFLINGIFSGSKKLMQASNVEFAIAVPGNWVPSHNNQSGVTTTSESSFTDYGDSFVAEQTYLANQLNPDNKGLWEGRLTHSITAGAVDIYHHIKFLKDTRINVGYLAMFPMSDELQSLKTPNEIVSGFDGSNEFITLSENLCSAVAKYSGFIVATEIKTPSVTIGQSHSDDFDSMWWDRPGRPKLYWRTWVSPQTVSAGTELRTHQKINICAEYQ